MKKMSANTGKRQYDLSRQQSLAADFHDSEDFVRSDRIEWLKELYAEWLEKRNAVYSYIKEPHRIDEPEELDAGAFWQVF